MYLCSELLYNRTIKLAGGWVVYCDYYIYIFRGIIYCCGGGACDGVLLYLNTLINVYIFMQSHQFDRLD